MIGVFQAVVGLIWSDEVGEDGLAVAGDGPVEGAAVDNRAADGRAIAGVELGGGHNDDVRAEVQRPGEGGGGDGVIHDERDLVVVGDLGDGRDIEDIGYGVAEGLAVEGLRIRPDGVLPGLRVIRVLDEGDVDA